MWLTWSHDGRILGDEVAELSTMLEVTAIHHELTPDGGKVRGFMIVLPLPGVCVSAVSDVLDSLAGTVRHRIDAFG